METAEEIQNIGALLASAALQWPERPAIKMGTQSLSYQELDSCIRKIQAYMETLGARIVAGPVAVLAFKSIHAIAICQAALRAGTYYTVIDPRYPAARVRQILEDCRASVLYTDQSTAFLEEALQGLIPPIVIKEDWQPLAAGGVSLDEILALTPTQAGCAAVPHERTAFVLYTSGSTGVPKGVRISHQNAAYSVERVHEFFKFGTDEIFLNHAHMGFDFCVLDYYNAWRAGAKIILVPEYETVFPAKVVELIRDEKVTNLWLVPTSTIAMIEKGDLLGTAARGVRRFLYAGEPFPVKYLRQVMTWMGEKPVYNLYGPTETNLLTWHHVRAEDCQGDDIPIGVALPGTELRVIDEGGSFVCRGTGELVAASPSVCAGYTNRPDLNIERFPSHDRRRWYRTGDICRIENDGRVWFLGRIDSMVKVRGYRVELREIECALARNPAVLQAVVLVHAPDCGDTKIIVAFCVVNGCINARALQLEVAERLPAYMVPGRICLVSAIPYNDRGKLDTKALLETLNDGRAAIA